jgi:hypothetical protein
MNENMQMGQDQEEAAEGNGGGPGTPGTPGAPGTAAPPTAMAGKGGVKVTVEEVVQLLMKGVQPQELVDAGVPLELIEKAVAIIKQQMQAQGGQAPAPQGGQPAAPQGGQGMGQGLASKMAGM